MDFSRGIGTEMSQWYIFLQNLQKLIETAEQLRPFSETFGICEQCLAVLGNLQMFGTFSGN